MSTNGTKGHEKKEGPRRERSDFLPTNHSNRNESGRLHRIRFDSFHSWPLQPSPLFVFFVYFVDLIPPSINGAKVRRSR
jgi:hypothetical protein